MSKRAKRNTPLLRFPEFEEDWNEKRLEELFSEFKSGYGITSEDIAERGTYPVFGGNGLRGYTESFTHDGFYFLIGRQGALCGNINRTYGKAYISEHAIACRANDTSDTEWLAQRLDYYNLNRLSESSAQPGLSVNKLLRFKLFVPSQEEQKKIASFLEAVDTRLNQLRRKRELLQTYKRGVMQKLFSQEIRFTQLDGSPFPDWEYKLAKYIFKSHSNKNHNGDLPILAATQDKGMIPRNEIDIKISSSEESIKSYKIVEKGDFVISLRSFQGGIEYSEFYGICSPAYTVLKPKVPIFDCFYKYLFKKSDFITRLSNIVVGIRDGKQISYEAFSGLKLPLPCIKEQEKIANFLTVIDRKIEILSRQIDQTEKFKKGLLQKMFV